MPTVDTSDMLSPRRSTIAIVAAPLAVLSLLLLGCAAPPPASISATAGDGRATVSYTDLGPDFDYEVRAMPGNHISRTDRTRTDVTGLDNGTEYTLFVRAKGIAGIWGEWSEGSAPVVPRGKPAAPTISRVAGFVDLETGCTARVTFAPGSDNGAPITGYEVSVTGGSAPVRGTSSPVEVSGLTPHTPYTFTVRAINAAGAGPASAAFTGSCS